MPPDNNSQVGTAAGDTSFTIISSYRVTKQNRKQNNENNNGCEKIPGCLELTAKWMRFRADQATASTDTATKDNSGSNNNNTNLQLSWAHLEKYQVSPVGTEKEGEHFLLRLVFARTAVDKIIGR